MKIVAVSCLWTCVWAGAICSSCNDVLAAPTLLREEKRTAAQRRVLIFRQIEMQEDQPNTSLQWLEITRTSKMFLQCSDFVQGEIFILCILSLMPLRDVNLFGKHKHLVYILNRIRPLSEKKCLSCPSVFPIDSVGGSSQNLIRAQPSCTFSLPKKQQNIHPVIYDSDHH